MPDLVAHRLAVISRALGRETWISTGEMSRTNHRLFSPKTVLSDKPTKEFAMQATEIELKILRNPVLNTLTIMRADVALSATETLSQASAHWLYIPRTCGML